MMRGTAAALPLLAALAACSAPTPAPQEDTYLWLEAIESERALAWVEAQNAKSLGYLEALAEFAPLYERNLEIYDSDERLPMPAFMGDYVWNFWRDAAHPRGIWRRTTPDDYAGGAPDWDIVLDLDALAAADNEDWVWKGSTCLRPEFRRCLLRLSRGGSDAVVVREFDTRTRDFVAGGFFIPESKVSVSWVDADRLYVGTDFGAGSLTDSGYPRTARVWQRGQALGDASEIWAGEAADVEVVVARHWDRERFHDIAERWTTIFTTQRYLYSADGSAQRIDIPDDAALHGFLHGQMIIGLKSDWTPADRTYQQGALLAIDFDAFMTGSRDFAVIVAPDAHSAIPRGGVSKTRDYLVVEQLVDVVSTLTRFEYADGEWRGMALDTERFGTISRVATSDRHNNFFFTYAGFTRPTTLYVAADGGRTIAPLIAMPAFFDAGGVSVEQYFATSGDGTRVPYFLVLPAGFEADGDTPTLIYAYGGFQVSITPSYGAVVGHSWLERGGAYVVANIRGGGEYGPAWHQAARRENRQRAYDDLVAVAQDLVTRGITRPEKLGVRGASNGGLLAGVMLTQQPELFNAVVVQVPLLDMQRYDKLLAGASWTGEYGDPDTDDWQFIRAYSPYHNIARDGAYPQAFFTTSTRDDRVHPGHARKMVARMQEFGHDPLYYENTVGGHAGASDNTQRARLQALIYSYLWDRLGGKAARP